MGPWDPPLCVGPLCGSPRSPAAACCIYSRPLRPEPREQMTTSIPLAGPSVGGRSAPPFQWCVVMSDTRRTDAKTEFWQLTAAINRLYAASHGYGFLRAKLQHNATSSPSKLATACSHAVHGPRAAPWCKIPVVAHAALHGVLGRRCSSIMYLDSDAYVSDPSLSIDAYLGRARRLGDEAVAPGSGEPARYIHE